MMDFAQLLALVAEGTGSLFSSIPDFFTQLDLGNMDLTSLGVGGVLAILAIVWFFVRLIRTIVSILFAIFVLLLVLQLTGYVDISSVWEQVSALIWPTPAEGGVQP